MKTMTIHERYPFTWKSSRTNYVILPDEQRVPEKNALSQDIMILDLSPRCYNALKRSAINTIEDVINKWDNLSGIRKVGVNSVIEIKDKMTTYLKSIGKINLIEKEAC